ncbi:MAG: hypothetical protein ACI8TA_003266 [Cyclobacteriaceae bacterium]|jgi:hypothetical protein
MEKLLNPNISDQEVRDIRNFLIAKCGYQFPCLDFQPPPIPDALFTANNLDIIGIEHTFVELRPSKKAGDLKLVANKKANRIWTEIINVLKRDGIIHLELDLTFNYNYLSHGFNLFEEIECIYKLISGFLNSEETDLYLIKGHEETIPNSLHSIRIRKNHKLKLSRVGLAHSTSQSQDIQKLINKAISKKSEKTYQTKNLKKLWLLLVIPDSKFPPMLDWPEKIYFAKNMIPLFDSVFLMDQIEPETYKEL